MAQADRMETYATQYYTGTQATIWIGDIWVDEVFGIQYSASQSVIPIFGYASTFFDAVAKGKVLVQGVFEINFIDEGYLYAVLNDRVARLLQEKEATDVIEKQRAKGSPIETISAIAGGRTQLDKIQDQLQFLRETATGNRIDSKSRQIAMGEIMNTIAQLDQISLFTMASNLNKDTLRPDKRNIIYEMIPFTLKGYFGNPELGGTDKGNVKELSDCFLVGNEMVIGSSDEIIKERYSFIARMHV